MNTNLQIQIRELRKPDLDAVINLAESVEDGPQWPPLIYAALVSPAELENHRTLVADDLSTGEVLGFITCSLIPPEAEIENIVVAGSSRKHGIGRQLLSEVIKQLGNAGIETIHLEVRASNRAAIGLYESQGFTESGRRRNYYSDPIEDAVLMRFTMR